MLTKIIIDAFGLFCLYCIVEAWRWIFSELKENDEKSENFVK